MKKSAPKGRPDSWPGGTIPEDGAKGGGIAHA